jgi:hypothetical protein
MLAKTIIQEIEKLPLSKRFWVMEQTLKSIKKEELKLESKILSQSDDIAIPESHKEIVRERILEAKANPKAMLDWDKVKNTF